MSTTIQNNHVVVANIQNTDGIDWQPKDNATVTGGNYGEVQNVTLLDGNLTVETDLGVLTFSGAELEPAKQTFTNAELLDTQEKLSNLNGQGFNFLEVMYLLFETNKERREVAREMRNASRDMAKSQAINAAKKIMEGALTNLIIGCVSGGLNMVMSAVSLGQSMKAMSQVKMEAQNVKMAKTEQRMAKTELELRETNAEIKQLETKAKVAELSPEEQVKLEGLKTKAEQLTAIRNEQKVHLQKKIEKADKDVQTAQEKVKQLQRDYSDVREDQPAKFAKLQRSVQESRLKAAENELDLAVARRDGLQQMQANSKQVDATPDDVDVARTWADDADANHGLATQNYNAKLSEAQNRIQLAQALNQLGGSVTDMLQRGGSYAESKGQSDAKIEDAHAEESRQGADDAREDMQSAQELLAGVQNFFDSVRQSLGETARAISRGFNA